MSKFLQCHHLPFLCTSEHLYSVGGTVLLINKCQIRKLLFVSIMPKGRKIIGYM